MAGLTVYASVMYAIVFFPSCISYSFNALFQRFFCLPHVRVIGDPFMITKKIKMQSIALVDKFHLVLWLLVITRSAGMKGPIQIV